MPYAVAVGLILDWNGAKSGLFAYDPSTKLPLCGAGRVQDGKRQAISEFFAVFVAGQFVRARGYGPCQTPYNQF